MIAQKKIYNEPKRLEKEFNWRVHYSSFTHDRIFLEHILILGQVLEISEEKVKSNRGIYYLKTTYASTRYYNKESC